jgi:hypothetical protein
LQLNLLLQLPRQLPDVSQTLFEAFGGWVLQALLPQPEMMREAADACGASSNLQSPGALPQLEELIARQPRGG